jgi:type III pantothenate kinase
MAYTIAIDVGNTRTKWGLFHIDELEHVVIHNNEDLVANNQVFSEYEIEGIIVSSVNEDAESKLDLEYYNTKVINLSHELKLPYILKYASPDTLGKDRIAVVAAAQSHYKNQNCLIIDAGTCITYDFLTNQNEYLGGAISPGVQLRLRAMNSYTNKLPMITWQQDERPRATGNTTIASMLSGVVNGLIGEMNSFISDYEKQYSELKIVLTGGDSKFFEKELKNGIFANPNLVLIGLHEIFKFNCD